MTKILIGYILILIVGLLSIISILKLHIASYWFIMPFTLLIICSVGGGFIEIKRHQRITRDRRRAWIDYKRTQHFREKWG